MENPGGVFPPTRLPQVRRAQSPTPPAPPRYCPFTFCIVFPRYSEKLGFLGTCPSNLGTGLRASVMIKLPKFNETEESREVLEQVRKT